MKERIQLLDIAVDIASTKTAGEATMRQMEEESSKVVYFVNSETLFLLQENKGWKDTVEESELILPGNASVNASVDSVLGHKRDPFFFETYFNGILDYAIEMGYELMLVAEDQDKFTFIQENIHEKRPFLTLSGMYLTEQKESLDHIVNEINSVAPDVLLMALEEEKQLQLLEQYRSQMNAGLMLFTGNILFNKAVSEAEVPEPIQKLRIESLYKWFRKGGRIKVFFNNLKMKLQLKQHNKE
ncbi:MAG: WecB/TagA/CpsF family glycosyltransferase [Bacteroidales bacterium]|nr:WecB/TagA/CpsF family glycosyltransferase [Clostridium sp.]MCM1205005.1 WecB/TagA/CpsF family glycosyltransferase [Bacteroidales bacterium]